MTYHFFLFICIVLFEMKFLCAPLSWVKFFNPLCPPLCFLFTEFILSTFNIIIDILVLVYHLIFFFCLYSLFLLFCFLLLSCELNEHFLDSILFFYSVLEYLFIYISDRYIDKDIFIFLY